MIDEVDHTDALVVARAGRSPRAYFEKDDSLRRNCAELRSTDSGHLDFGHAEPTAKSNLQLAALLDRTHGYNRPIRRGLLCRSDESAAAFPATALPLTRLADHPALVLLGEPGIGKSTALKAEAHRITDEAALGNTASVHVDLRAYSSESLLHRRLFESAEFIAWTQGTSCLVLHIDSLDEALLRIDSIANLLAEELPRYPTSRMSIRIACRTAV
jgi:hypothetical protein